MTTEVDKDFAATEFKYNSNYVVYECLGQGAYGKVFRVFDKIYNKTLAAKIVARTADGESNLWPQLQHPNILRLLRTDRISDGCIAYLMPYVGNDLFSVLYNNDDFHSNNLCFARKKSYILDVLLGLEYLHKNRLCHLDLKEENVLVCCTTDSAVISDFSTLCTFEQVSCKSFGLMELCLPPEVASKNRKSDIVVGYAAEMWTYGVFVLQAFTKQYLTRKARVHESYDENFLPRVIAATGQDDTRKIIVNLHKKAFESPGKEPTDDITELLDFIDKFLVIEPVQRYTASMALEHPFLVDHSCMKRMTLDSLSNGGKVEDDVLDKMAMLSIAHSRSVFVEAENDGFSSLSCVGFLKPSMEVIEADIDRTKVEVTCGRWGVGDGQSGKSSNPISEIASKSLTSNNIFKVNRLNSFGKATKRYWCTETKDEQWLPFQSTDGYIFKGNKKLCFGETYSQTQNSKTQFLKVFGKYTGLNRIRNILKPVHHFEIQKEPRIQFSKEIVPTVMQFTAKNEACEVQKKRKRTKSWFDNIWRKWRTNRKNNKCLNDVESSYLITPKRKNYS